MTGKEPIARVSGTGVPVRGNDIDTDQIIPARFLKAVTFDGLGAHAFHDLRFHDEGSVGPKGQRNVAGETAGVKDHPFNEDRFRGASVLVVNDNFGCGSSREHAPQALRRWGIDAVVGESFAEIFAGNCLALGIPTVTADRDIVTELQDYVDEHPDAVLDVDVENETVSYDDREISVRVDDAKRRALVDGVWDTTALLKSNADTVAATADSLPYVDR